MGRYGWLADIGLTEDGDLALDETGDFAVHYGLNCLEDDIRIRIQTNKSEWRRHITLGSNMEDLIGLPNTEKTGEIGRKQLIEALTRDDKVNINDLSVHVMPTDTKTILYFILIDAQEDGEVRIPYVLKL
ncbi:MAG TPA: hypothetical protein GXZ48_08245 [Acholeplasmataceae bacterium]|mgnify:CR=1 FL=1|nr:hypothetical protein [Acholeplasmataceae bacterium]